MVWQYRTTVLLLCMFAFFVTMVARLAISPVVPLIATDFAISNTHIGLALTGMWLAYALAQYPSGLLADRFGEKRIILIAVGGTAVMSFFSAGAPVFLVFVIGVVVLGGVAGLHYSVATLLFSRTYDDVGTAIGVHLTGAPLAGLVAPIVAAWVGVEFGWRYAVAVGGVFAIPVFVLFYWRVRPIAPRRPGQAIRDRLSVRSNLGFLRRPPIAFSIGIAVLGMFVSNALMSFLPTFLIAYRGYTATIAGVVFAAYFIVRGVGQVGVGALSDRLGGDHVITGCMLAWAVGLVVFVLGPGHASVALGVVLNGIGVSMFAGLEPRILGHFGDVERGAGFGLVRTVYGVLGALGSVGIGLSADLVGWAASFYFLAALCLVVVGALSVNLVFDLGY